jgi:transcriptional regulator with XRE-family HTH domain
MTVSFALLDSIRADYIAPAYLSDRLHITLAELAATLGVSRDAVTKTTRLQSKATQGRLREMLEILNRAEPWAGSLLGAYAWYRSQGLPSFGDATAETLVRQGRAEDVRHYLDRIAAGGFA